MSLTTVLVILLGLAVVAFIVVGVRALLRSETDLLSESVDEDRARELVRDAVEWAEQRLPPSTEKFPNVPERPVDNWYLYGAVAAIEVAVIRLVQGANPSKGEALAEHVDAVLASTHPEAQEAFQICAAQYVRHLETIDKPSMPNFLGMWLWKQVVDEKPTSDQHNDVDRLGQLVFLAFSHWWGKGVREVAVGENGSVYVTGTPDD